MINTKITDKSLLEAIKTVDWGFDRSHIPKCGAGYVELRFVLNRDFVFPICYNSDHKEDELITLGDYLGEEFERVTITDSCNSIFDDQWGLERDYIEPELCYSLKNVKCEHCGGVKVTRYVSRSMELFSEKFCK